MALAAAGGSGAATASASPSKTTSPPTATVRVANSRLGTILVDSQGRTLYLFKKDSGTRSACLGACAKAWPPLLTGGASTAASGARPSLVRTTRRSDGTRQVTYNGHPLYLFIKDHKPGDVNGQGVTAFGAAWFAVSPAGNQISRPAAPKPAPKPTAKPVPGIPQNNGGDGDSDNNGGPSDGDGNF
jgi:predicted lipoprotein with Yx(FWY)xxD motif